MKARVLLATLLLGGCVTPIAEYKAMSPEQIAALVKDKTAAANCVVLNTPYGRGVSTYMALDKSVLEKGALLTIDEQCKMSLQQGTTQAPPQFIQVLPTPVPAPQRLPEIRPQSLPEPILGPLIDVLKIHGGMHR